MSAYIAPTAGISQAWLDTLSMVHAAGGHAINVLSTVTEPLSDEDPHIRSVLDDLLVEGHRKGTRIQTVETVAGTIFPADMYADPGFSYSPDLDTDSLAELDTAASDLYAAYLDMLPVLITDPANNRGTYFGRMISWPGKTGNGHNQLADRIRYLRTARRAHHSQQNVDDITIGGEGDETDGLPDLGMQVYAANDRRQRGFPCLVHVDLTLYANRLSMIAVYRHQYLVTKAYGNLLGLSRLLHFLAQQTGYAVGELAIQATMADAEQKTYLKSGLDQLIAAATPRALA